VELTYCQLTRQHNGDSWQAGPTGSAYNGEILTCGTAMGPKQEKSRQYLVCPHFVQNGSSEELPTQLFKWRLLQATKIPVKLWQGTRWPQTKSPRISRSLLRLARRLGALPTTRVPLTLRRYHYFKGRARRRSPDPGAKIGLSSIVGLRSDVSYYPSRRFPAPSVALLHARLLSLCQVGRLETTPYLLAGARHVLLQNYFYPACMPWSGLDRIC
jgi:hypothetical protein